MKTPEEMAGEWYWANLTEQAPIVMLTNPVKHPPCPRKAFIAGYKAGQQWISVKDRLPEFNEYAYTDDVLMAFHDGTMAVLPFQRRDGSIKTGHFDKIETVAAWMPLPEAPKGEK